MTMGDRFDRAVALACEMVEGACRIIDVNLAEDLHHPLVWAALRSLARADPILMAKLSGAHGRWMDTPMLPDDSYETLRTLFESALPPT